jgi:hypothetical protein
MLAQPVALAKATAGWVYAQESFPPNIATMRRILYPVMLTMSSSIISSLRLFYVQNGTYGAMGYGTQNGKQLFAQFTTV